MLSDKPSFLFHSLKASLIKVIFNSLSTIRIESNKELSALEQCNSVSRYACSIFLQLESYLGKLESFWADRFTVRFFEGLIFLSFSDIYFLSESLDVYVRG